MPIEIVRIDAEKDYPECIRRAARILRDGGVVGFPTETVYGIGARADSHEAVARLRKIKQREESKPFTVHIGQPEDVVRFVPNPVGLARRFIRKGWPGPLTLVFTVDEPASAPVIRESAPDRMGLIYYEQTVGIRCPSDKTASDLLTEAGVPIVAASANRSGEPPPRSADGVIAGLDSQVDLVLDGGETRYAQSSTVVKLVGTGYEILREGVIDARTLKRLGSLNILFVCSGNTCRSPMAAALCERALAKKLGCRESELHARGIHVSSAGAFAMGGSSASEGAKHAMSALSINLSGHTAHPLDVETICRADYIFCMTRTHVDAVLSRVPTAEDRTSLLGGDTEIDDPFGGSADTYKECAESICAALDSKLSEISL